MDYVMNSFAALLPKSPVTALIAVGFSVLWYWQFVLRSKPDKKIIVRILIAFLAAGVLATQIVNLAQVAGAALAVKLAPDSQIVFLAVQLSAAGIAAELLKLAAAVLLVYGLKDERPIDLLLIFGAAGMGFELFENFLYDTGTAGNMIYRGIFATHLLPLYYEGFCWIRHQAGANRFVLKGLIAALALRIAYDVGPVAMASGSSSGIALGVLIYSAILIVFVIFAVVMLLRVNRTVRALNCKDVAQE